MDPVNPNLDPDLKGKLHKGKIRWYVKKDLTYHVFKICLVTLDLRQKPKHCALPEKGLDGWGMIAIKAGFLRMNSFHGI